MQACFESELFSLTSAFLNSCLKLYFHFLLISSRNLINENEFSKKCPHISETVFPPALFRSSTPFEISGVQSAFAIMWFNLWHHIFNSSLNILMSNLLNLTVFVYTIVHSTAHNFTEKLLLQILIHGYLVLSTSSRIAWFDSL